MPKKKNPFQVRKINKRKKSLPAGRVRKAKSFVHQYDGIMKQIALTVIVVLATVFVYHYQETAQYLFKASVLETPPPFDGTSYPVDRVPDWTNWNGDNHTDHFSTISANLLVALPSYDLQQLQFPSDSLVWGNNDHDHIRNSKITYPVVYLGNYQLDHHEGVGSHLAVDIKMPVGTPIKSIASGRVTKVSHTESGFGHHVVVEHRNVPDPDDPNKKTTLYSAFNHMDQIYVNVGQVVEKGEVIGTSGNTGTSTTPHLHFQIDRDSAPWHPYWAFSWSEAQAAGLSFFEAVNAGLGLNNAKQHTINPMLYVSKYINYDGGDVGSGDHDHSGSDHSVSDDHSSSHSEEDTEEDTSHTKETPVEENPVEEIPEGNEDPNVDTGLFAFKMTGEGVSMVGSGVTVTATDELNQISKMSDSDEVIVNISGVGRLSKKGFRKVDFKSGSIQFIVNSSESGTAQIQVGKSAHEVSFIDQVQPIAALRIDTDGNFQKNQIEMIKIVALDENGNPTPAVNFAGTIEIKAKEGDAQFTPDRIAVNDFRSGIAEVRMISSGEDRIKIRAQNGALIGESDHLYVESDRQFVDVSKAHPNYQAIKYLSDNGIIGGYSDGSFQPGKTVNRVEALKMLMLAFDLEAGPAGALPFSDTEDGAWYSATLATALEKAIVKGYEDGSFKPSNTVNKAEYLKMLFLTAGITPNGDLVANPYDDVPKDAWYAPFAYMTNKKNLLEVKSNRLSAGSGMTRGDVAETIYRLRYIQDNNLVTYSR